MTLSINLTKHCELFLKLLEIRNKIADSTLWDMIDEQSNTKKLLENMDEIWKLLTPEEIDFTEKFTQIINNLKQLQIIFNNSTSQSIVEDLQKLLENTLLNYISNLDHQNNHQRQAGIPCNDGGDQFYRHVKQTDRDKYNDQWIAIHITQGIIANANTVEELMRKLKQFNFSNDELVSRLAIDKLCKNF